MSRTEIVNSVIAKHDAPAGAEPAPDPTVAPPGGESGAGSAPADVEAPLGASPAEHPAGQPASPGATIDHDVLRARLEADRNRRRVRMERKQAQQESAAAKKAREEAEAERAKWQGIGKNQSWLEAVKAAGHDPRKAFEEMQAEARRAGTPEAQLESMSKAFEAKIAQLEAEKIAPLQKQLEEERAEKEALRKQATEQRFVNDFQRGLGDDRFKSLLDEYDPPDLFRIANGLRNDPERLFNAARQLNVSLTGDDGTFSMVDILSVMRATQAAHQARMQRRNQNAAPQTSQASQQQPPQAKAPVNGTVERNAAPSTIGNDLASSSASEADVLRGMNKAQRVAYLEKKYANAR